jgi:hypothetical protein
VAAAAVLAGGGAITGAALASNGSQPANQGAALSASVNSAGSSSSAASSAKRPAGKGALARLRRLRGIHGEATVRMKNGGFREVAFERGAIQSVSGQDVVVRSADGTTWTWTLASNTLVRDRGAKASASSLAAGDPVLVAGAESGSTRTAKVIIVPKKTAGGSSASPSTGSSPSASGS